MLRMRRGFSLGAAAVLGLLSFGLGAATAAPVRRAAPERALAGVRIGTRGVTVLQRFGEPTSVRIGTATPDANGGAGAGFGATPGPATGGGAGPYGAPGAGPSPYGPSSYRMNAGGPGPLPPAGYTSSPYGPYGPGGGGPAAGAAADASASGDITQPQDYSGRLVTWTYRYPRQGLVLDFQLDEDGRVVQIVATGLRPTSMARTQRGVTFGDSYSKVLRLYGFPESQSQPGSGSVIVADYRNRSRVAFQFINLKVVRIVVAELQ